MPLSFLPRVVIALLTVAATPLHPTLVQPPIIAHARWQATAPLGHGADAVRRNVRAGDTLTFKSLQLVVLGTSRNATDGPLADSVRLALAQGSSRETRSMHEGGAFNWAGFHVAVVAVYGPGELGAGLVALEIATQSSLPPSVATSDSAGGASMRLRIPHTITHVTLHHTGDARPLQPTEDPAQRLRNLQAWGARERNWWDVPYHFLLDLEGDVYEGRDWHFMGETNTAYNPSGHFLISMIGNYDQQEPSSAQLAAIADLMAWAIRENGLTVDAIGGHYHYASTGCPGKYLRPYLEDGTIKRMVQERLTRR
ncbi:N-acetylmuramoyl-L-alanine amidase [Gemmatimonas phototrophica]|uniref:N-acetylmuramoyl-L-alanine amidase n=1 Tax=Gemmatimonas phototrophica TaxID=1379270 RepID=UPI0006A738A7|nr:N-acetylmuramoyl-L-alanine amidase [Gemmatimonas phototrophica]